MNEHFLNSIWNYLVKITQEDGVTVIITTHYIEEAKQASTVNITYLISLSFCECDTECLFKLLDAR